MYNITVKTKLFCVAENSKNGKFDGTHEKNCVENLFFEREIFRPLRFHLNKFYFI